MKDMVRRHFPEYPVVDDRNRLIGIVRGETIFQQHAFELTAQVGRMVGVEADERVATSWPRSLRFRQPWLQLNLLTAFAAAAVVAFFQGTIDRLVLLAVFLPVLAGPVRQHRLSVDGGDDPRDDAGRADGGARARRGREGDAPRRAERRPGRASAPALPCTSTQRGRTIRPRSRSLR